MNSSEKRKTDFLDRMIPLQGAQHADVASYAVDAPMRYSQCYATLFDGRKVRFQDTRKFVGWMESDEHSSFLFRSGFRRIEILTAKNGTRRIVTWLSAMLGRNDLFMRPDDQPLKSRFRRARKFTARDGSMLVVSPLFSPLVERLCEQGGRYEYT